jgi:hypothetical protein
MVSDHLGMYISCFRFNFNWKVIIGILNIPIIIRLQVYFIDHDVHKFKRGQYIIASQRSLLRDDHKSATIFYLSIL